MNGTTLQFWVLPKPPWIFRPELCLAMIAEIQGCMVKAMATGVMEYTVGSRQVKRFALKDLQNLLAWWQWQLQTAMVGSSIVARRAIPTDY